MWGPAELAALAGQAQLQQAGQLGSFARQRFMQERERAIEVDRER